MKRDARDPLSEVTLWHAPELKAELLRARFVDFTYDVHTHETACFALLTEGRIRIRMRGSEFVAQAGDLYAIDADEAHAGWAVDAQGWRQRTLYVDLAHLATIAGDERAAVPARLAGPIIRDARLTQQLHTLHRCSQDGGSFLLRDEAYLGFAAGLMQRHARGAAPARAPGREDAGVRRAREFLDQNLGARVSLDAIARSAGLPPFQLFRAFRRDAGMSPHAYQRQARVRLAMRLIRAGHALADAGALAGFADQAHLTRWFRRFMGVTPGQYQLAVAAAGARPLQ